MTTIRLGLARRDDAADIAEMSRRHIEHGLPWSWTEARVLRCILHAESAVLVARDRRRLAGFAIMEFLDEHAHLNLLAVHPGYRRRGVGVRLIEWLESSARTAGTFLVRLELRASNDGARKFYQKLGYREVGRRGGYYSGREDAICMAHDLRIADFSGTEDFQWKHS
ncbi:MAG TPA: ribosomal protein S18-alanine N-acetyltransferase [Gammaproteobacteria bacterium]|nr:ribosomal protein S18-alanine N-acetyltransferase [Gammaproteobacteria bacterium]